MNRASGILMLAFTACAASAVSPGPRGRADAAGAEAGQGQPAQSDAATALADAPSTSPEAGVVMPGAPVPLPLVVTEQFPNLGWFGDPAVMAHFQPGSMVIRQAPGSTGPCAARRPGARGRCLEISYTPPPDLQPGPSGGWVGVYFLRSLQLPHPEAAPPARAGDPNWGLEPGLPVVPGATRIAFVAAAAQAGVRVTFRAGTDKDAFVLPEQSELLATAWTAYALPLAGATYPSGVVGAFAWVIKETSKPATFYLDDLVWEGGGPTTPVAPVGKRDGVRQLSVINKCAQTVWLGVYGTPVPEGGGFRLDAGQSRTITVPPGKWTGRLWGRTGCAVDGAAARCETGDCGQKLMCGGATGKTPATLAEFTMGDGANPDFYDLSLVDGYNLPMAIAPLEGTYTPSPGAPHDCLSPACTHDLNTTCPSDLRLTGAAGQVVGCLSACERFKTDELCCAGAHNQPATCPPSSYAKIFKDACPTAYSYAYDDATSTFTCKGEDYAIWFCP
jgi:hypothetical protein